MRRKNQKFLICIAHINAQPALDDVDPGVDEVVRPQLLPVLVPGKMGRWHWKQYIKLKKNFIK
jgi:hypothetical protein